MSNKIAIFGAARSAAFPPNPSRLEMLKARVPFQGFTAFTEEFGRIPIFGPETTTLDDADLASYVRQCMACTDDLGVPFNAVEIAVSWNYDESPAYRYPVPGRDYSQNIAELKRRIALMVYVGEPLGLKAVYVFCAGDGESNPAGGYNDARGWTYGRSWLMANFQRIYDQLGPTDTDPTDVRGWCNFAPGYDACDAYQWLTGQNVANWWHLQRATLDRGGKGHAVFEWPAGQIQLGDGFPTYAAENGGCVDGWLLELPPGPYPPTQRQAIQQITQQLGRALRPYNRPEWAVDDPNPPLLIPPMTLRGPATVQIYEFDTYPGVRGMPAETINADRRVLRSICPAAIIC